MAISFITFGLVLVISESSILIDFVSLGHIFTVLISIPLCVAAEVGAGV